MRGLRVITLHRSDSEAIPHQSTVSRFPLLPRFVSQHMRQSFARWRGPLAMAILTPQLPSVRFTAAVFAAGIVAVEPAL